VPPRKPTPPAAIAESLERKGVPLWFVLSGWDSGLTTAQIMAFWGLMLRRNPVIDTPTGYVLIPKRKPGENFLSWLARCQEFVLDRAVTMGVDGDPNLRAERVPGGWRILTVDTGLRIDVQTSATMEKRDADGTAPAKRGRAG